MSVSVKVKGSSHSSSYLGCVPPESNRNVVLYVGSEVFHNRISSASVSAIAPRALSDQNVASFSGVR